MTTPGQYSAQLRAACAQIRRFHQALFVWGRKRFFQYTMLLLVRARIEKMFTVEQAGNLGGPANNAGEGLGGYVKLHTTA